MTRGKNVMIIEVPERSVILIFRHRLAPLAPIHLAKAKTSHKIGTPPDIGL
jgi:hypothetical protein